MQGNTSKTPTGTNREIISYKVHHILAHSYTFFFSFVIIGVMLDVFFQIKLLSWNMMVPLGYILLILGTILIFWAQHTSRSPKKGEITALAFCKGPYRYTRVPTHLGLFLLALGFGLIVNAFFVVMMSIIAFVLNKLVYLNEEEKMLELKYGDPYTEYKQKVRF